MSKKLNRPNIKKADTMDALLGLDGVDIGGVQQIDISSLVDFANHPFVLYSDERLEDMVESVKNNGIIQPLIVREKSEGVYEILSGHNRRNAALRAELLTVPAIVLKNISDEKALAYVIETNLMQRSFEEMSYTEKLEVIKLHYDNLFSQGKRNDISNEIDTLGEKDAKSLLSADEVGEKYSMSSAQVSRYLRLQYLIPGLQGLLNDGRLSFVGSVALSFLTKDEQGYVFEILAEYESFKIDSVKVKKLRDLSKEEKLDKMEAFKILSDYKDKIYMPPTVRLDAEAHQMFFRQGQTKQEIEDTIKDALFYYFEKHPEKLKPTEDMSGDEFDPFGEM